MTFRIVLIGILALIVAMPLEPTRTKTMLALFGGVVPLIGGRLGAHNRWLPVVAGLCVLLSLHSLAGLSVVPETVVLAALLIYFGSASGLVLKHVFRSRAANSEVLCGAIAAYLLLGLSWASGFALLEHHYPGSLRAPEPLDSTGLFYFTFITLLTIGYGDIVPVAPMARIMTVLAGITGVIFTTVALSALVSMRIRVPE